MKIKGRKYPKLKGNAYSRRMDREVEKSIASGVTPLIGIGLLETMTALINDCKMRKEDKLGAYLKLSLNSAEFGDIFEVVAVDKKFVIAFIGVKYINGKAQTGEVKVPEKFREIKTDGSNIHWAAATEIEGTTVWIPVDEARKVWVHEFTNGESEYITVQTG